MGEDEDKEPTDYSRRAQIFHKSSRRKHQCYHPNWYLKTTKYYIGYNKKKDDLLFIFPVFVKTGMGIPWDIPAIPIVLVYMLSFYYHSRLLFTLIFDSYELPFQATLLLSVTEELLVPKCTNLTSKLTLEVRTTTLGSYFAKIRNTITRETY